MTTDMRRLMMIVEGAVLSEAPIGDIHFFGSDEPASLSAADIGIVKNPKGQAKIRRVMEKAPVLIHLAFVNHPYEYHSDGKLGIGDPARKIITPRGKLYASGAMTPAEFANAFGHALRADPNAVTAVIALNDGDFKLPLTPWIIAHRIGHALNETHRSASIAPFNTLLQSFYRIVIELPFDSAKIGVDPDDVAHAVGTWKSAREGKMSDCGEFVLEAFAAYLTRGKVTLNPVTTDLVQTISLRGQKSLRPEFVAQWQGRHLGITQKAVDKINEEVERWRRLAERTFLATLQANLGKIVVL